MISQKIRGTDSQLQNIMLGLLRKRGKTRHRGSVQYQINTLALGGVLFGAVTALFSKPTIYSPTFDIGIIGLVLGFIALIGY